MITVLVVLAAVLGYLGVGAVLARVAWRLHHASLDTPSKTLALIFGWPFFLVAFGVVSLTDGIHDVITRPTEREKLERRRIALQDRIDELERDLDVPSGNGETPAPAAERDDGAADPLRG